MASQFDYVEEIGLLRRAVTEPVRQIIAVEFDTLACIDATLKEMAALDPKRAHLAQHFDFERDTAAGLLQIVREKLKRISGSTPVLLALVGPAKIEAAPGAPASKKFWQEMNQVREAWDGLGTQLLLCLERWSFEQAQLHADHLLSWASMKIHLVGSTERPAASDRTALSVGLFGDYHLSPGVARERWQELEQGWSKARESGEAPGGFLQRFFIPMLEAALAAGDLVLARRTREIAQEQGQFPDGDMPRWHELNLALALAEHDANLANEHAWKLLSLAENHPEDRVRARALVAVNNQALLLKNTANFDLAEPLFRQSLQLAERSHGPEHPEVAIRLNNLAQLLQATNRLAEAEPLMRRCVLIRRQFREATGHQHPDWPTTMDNYQALLQAMNVSQSEIDAKLRGLIE